MEIIVVARYIIDSNKLYRSEIFLQKGTNNTEELLETAYSLFMCQLKTNKSVGPFK